MDIIRITMRGYGCKVNKGVINANNIESVEVKLNNVWLKDLYEEIGKEVEIDNVFSEFGLISGDIEIEVNGEKILDLPINSLEFITTTKLIVVDNKTEGDSLISIQHQEGIFSDTIFVLNEKFDLNKLCLIKKSIDLDGLETLYSGLTYQGEVIPITDTSTDLRMSRMFINRY
jgi:hypothetical protein